MKECYVKGPYIKLNQWLKKEGLAYTGGEAGMMVEQGLVTLNGQKVTEIRKKLHDGDEVSVNGAEPYRILVKE